MTQNDEKADVPKAALCIKCQDMYGSANYDHMCSKCYKQQKKVQSILLTPTTVLAPPVVGNPLENCKKQDDISKKRLLPHDETASHIKGKCNKCSKKTGLLGYDCKHCSNEFCKLHRLPEDHSCEVDFITLGRKQIKQSNPNVSLKKIEQI